MTAGPQTCRLPEPGSPEEAIRRVLAMNVIAVVGCSPKPERAGHYVAEYLKANGYKIVPVNPGHEKLLGETCYPSLADIPFPVDVVDVFRNPAFVLPVIEEAINIRAKAIWLQDGITHPEGEALAREAGLIVISDDCLLRRHRQLAGR